MVLSMNFLLDMVSGEKSLVPCGTLGLLIFIGFGIAEMQEEKKMRARIAPLQPVALAVFPPWGSSRGAGRADPRREISICQQFKQEKIKDDAKTFQPAAVIVFGIKKRGACGLPKAGSEKKFVLFIFISDIAY